MDKPNLTQANPPWGGKFLLTPASLGRSPKKQARKCLSPGLCLSPVDSSIEWLCLGAALVLLKGSVSMAKRFGEAAGLNPRQIEHESVAHSPHSSGSLKLG